MYLAEMFFRKGEHFLCHLKSAPRPEKVVPGGLHRPEHPLAGALLLGDYPLEGGFPGLFIEAKGPSGIEHMGQREGCFPGGLKARPGETDLPSSDEDGMERGISRLLIEKGDGKVRNSGGCGLVEPGLALGDALPSRGQDWIIFLRKVKGFFKREGGTLPRRAPAEDRQKKKNQKERLTPDFLHGRASPERTG